MITCGRAAFATFALAIFAFAQKRPLVHQLTWRKVRIFVFTGLLLTSHWVTFFIAVKVGGVAVATLGFASFPAFIAMLDALVFRERIGVSEALLLVLVTAGLILVVPSFDFGDNGTIGLVWGLVSGLSFAMLAMTNRRAGAGLDPIQVAFWQNIVVAAVLLPFAIGGVPALGTTDWVHLTLLGIVCTGLSHYLFVKSLGGLSARSVGMIIALEPVYAIACAWWLFSEQPSVRMLLGAALIIFAIALSTRSKAPEMQPA
ncbi:membrane protein [Hydrogenophaga electricum]|uniref:Membrane protein n=1 Tax=Hydrogenophaga electricum TaxID=1230953 RepID=A0ABQ6BZ19_9BURK|nr:membrane protein [Hydrogenophaga electricum]